MVFDGIYVAAALFGSHRMAAAAFDNRPLRLEVVQGLDRYVIRVLGKSQAECRATYELKVSSGRGGNSSINRAAVTLFPGVQNVVATVAVGAASNPSATLKVQACGGVKYEITWPDPARSKD